MPMQTPFWGHRIGVILLTVGGILAGCAKNTPPVSRDNPAAVVRAVQQAPQVWTLKPINGHKPEVWNAGDNWTHRDGNPLADQGGKWTLAVQNEKNPSLTAPYEPMTAGTYVAYTFSGRAPVRQLKSTNLGLSWKYR